MKRLSGLAAVLAVLMLAGCRPPVEALEAATGETPEALVAESFRFLLEREPPESILRSFELPIIGRYFADYAEEIRRRLGGG